MTRVYHTFPVNDISLFKQQMLSWANQFNICCFLDNCNYESRYHSYELVAGFDSHLSFQPSSRIFSSLDEFISANNDWIFAHFNYEFGRDDATIKTEANGDTFPECFLFVPEIVCILQNNLLTMGVLHQDANAVFADIQNQPFQHHSLENAEMKPTISREQYMETVLKLQQHIKHGDCYEINFCQKFSANVNIHPTSIFRQLLQLSPNPFSAFYRLNDNFLLCASPERFLKKTGDKLISQPIKGTAARNKTSDELDDLSKERLKVSDKERSENVMIVDLVRNDLSKVCVEGSVTVEELFGVYTFPQVHQMISTVTGTLQKEKKCSDILKATFPMGSMTGAPKKKVMELISHYEVTRRGIYSGTVGYISPSKDFDFNVVIRSLVYNSSTNNLSFHVGSAITALSDPAKEYEECVLKGEAMVKVLSRENQ